MLSLKLPIYATAGTAEMLAEIGIDCTVVEKHAGASPNAIELIERGAVDLVINIPREYDQFGRPDGVLIRRAAVDAAMPLVTDLQLARALIEALRVKSAGDLRVLPWQEFVARGTGRLTQS